MPGHPRIAVLGPVLVMDPTGTPTPVPGALARAFVTALVLARGHAMSTDAIIDELWGEAQSKGSRAALQTLVSRLRRSTADGLVVSTSTGYALGVGPDDVDLAAAERVAGTAGAADDDVRAALELWRGDPGADVEGDLGAALGERAATARRGLRRALGSALLASGDADAAVDLWREQADADPFDEVAVAGSMRALAAAGRTTEALAAFAAHRERLADGLGADPSADLVRLNAELLRRSASASGAVRRIGLRASPNALIGREADLTTVADLLSRERLVTILGAGGLGKTRLAQAVAASVPADRGVVVLELAPLAAGDDIVPALGALLGIAEVRSARALRDAVVADLRGRVVRALGDEPTVLVLDNCEHLVADVAAFTADLLAVLPALRVLTTSRAPLAIAGEVVAPLAPLPVEAEGAAVRLFTERARAARPGAVLPVDTVRRICTRLDGTPLAIELAAARIRGMSAEEIERRLDDRFALLRGGDRTAPERHRTLLAVIEWSWRLLDDGAQDLLTRLALFPDGLAVDAVEAVAADERRDDALDDLAELVEQSLVQLVEREGDPVRYRVLETVREFGAARLDERGRTDEVRAAMIRWGRDFSAARNMFAATGEPQRRYFREVGREADNLVTLLRWGLQAEDRPAVAQVFSALGGYWTLRGAHGEVVAIATDVVTVLRQAPPAAEDRAATILGLVLTGGSSAFSDRRTAVRAISTLRHVTRAGWSGFPVLDAQAALLLTIGRPAEGMALLARYREDPDDGVACLAHMLSAPLAENDGEFALALRYAQRGETLAVTVDDAWAMGSGAVTMTQLLAQTGRYTDALAAAALARERLEVFGAEDDLYEIGWTVGLCAAATGDVTLARSIAAELGNQPVANRGGFDGDAAQIGVLAIAIDAECSRSLGDLGAAAARYGDAWDFVLPRRKQTPHWTLMAGAARLAALDESTVGRSDGTEPGLPAVATTSPIARRMRVGALVMLRLHPWWLDLPVIGTALLGLALAAARLGDHDRAARCWGLASRFGSRQDFAVLAHARIRPLLVEVLGDRTVLDAETASAGWDRAEAVAQARLLLEELRFS
ncbi:BTAD domain-containing putative transcriptional regulator [Curtobacterium sp. PhB136]|uniref:BTAD domain-containing putative transcriptional regulator n=1 Tax=Curtobacterium sp. PhB136 TaxID=2485181 RepID=UPI0010534926|nr:BTAD domain-containing putative transcriptional regulator [Curtobacterium sp. PhB136]TCK66283.1 putative ATPase [Curtobacterium sp. PhB136]